MNNKIIVEMDKSFNTKEVTYSIYLESIIKEDNNIFTITKQYICGGFTESEVKAVRFGMEVLLDNLESNDGININSKVEICGKSGTWYKGKVIYKYNYPYNSEYNYLYNSEYNYPYNLDDSSNKGIIYYVKCENNDDELIKISDIDKIRLIKEE